MSHKSSAAQWISTTVAYAYARPIASGEPFSCYFALDTAGHPRFVYYDAGADASDPQWGAFYAGCDNGCTNPANWGKSQLLQDDKAQQVDLAVSTTSQVRIAYTSYDKDNIKWYVAYAECESGCFTARNWSTLRLVDTVSASVTEFATFSLRVDSNGHPRLALYMGTGVGGTLTPNKLYLLWCAAASCMQGQSWQALDLNLPNYSGEDGVSLALDSQNRPRIAYHAGLTTGDGLYYVHCNANCGAAASWQSGRVEPSAKVTPNCPFRLIRVVPSRSGPRPFHRARIHSGKLACFQRWHLMRPVIRASLTIRITMAPRLPAYRPIRAFGRLHRNRAPCGA